MRSRVEILPLRTFTREEVWPIVTGYTTQEIYTVEKTESDERLIFDFRLVLLDQLYRATFFEDFTPEDCQWYQSLLPQGYSFGAYSDNRLVGLVIGEAFPKKRLLRVWEIHVVDEFRRQGIGRALLERVFDQAQQDRLAMVMLETQNTNVKAIRFYRRMGFSVDAVSLSKYFYLDGVQSTEVGFFMKRRLETVE